MEINAWMRRLREGSEAEYDRRHRAVFPELEAAMRAAGVTRYAIFRDGRSVIGCFEAADGFAALERVQASEASRRWQQSMAPLFEPVEGANWGIAKRLERVWALAE
jgi:L-rhamnose mutarotase